MTRTDKDVLVCKCGHKGHLVLRDGSTPHSCLLEFSLEGFSGALITSTRYEYMPEDVLAALNPKCPVCGGIGTVGPPKRTVAENAKLMRQYLRGEKRAEQKVAARNPAAKKMAMVAKRAKAPMPGS
jgi:hypothetical protein